MSHPMQISRQRARQVTIRHIAELAGVSIATVSRVVNGRDDVAPETRERVQRIIREKGYATNKTVRGVSVDRLVGLLVPLVAREYYAAIVAGLAEALAAHDMGMLLSPTNSVHDREASLLDLLARGLTEGAVLVLPEESSAELEAVIRSGYRFVVYDPRTPLGKEIPAVTAANAGGAEQAVRHLLQLGHRRIGAITGPATWVATTERLRGYRTALAAAGVEPELDLVLESDFEIPGGTAAAGELLDGPDPPTAIFAFNDLMAIGTLHAARARGLRVPEDLSIVGFDDLPHAIIPEPALTTVRQPLAEMAWIAVSLLTRLLDRQQFETLQVELATHLVVRESTGPAANRRLAYPRAADGRRASSS